MEVYTRVFALDMAATLAVPFTADGRDAAEILRSLPPAGWRLSGRRPGLCHLVKEIKTNAFQTRQSQSVASESLTVPAAEALRLSSMTRASFRPGLERNIHTASRVPSPSHCTMTSFELRSPGPLVTS